jgi:hypothetical protein
MQGTESGKDNRIQTTIRIPPNVYKRAKSLLNAPGSEIGTFNDLVVEALQAFVHAARRKHIDDAFLMMASDRDYQQEARNVADEFEESDWEALAQSGKR